MTVDAVRSLLNDADAPKLAVAPTEMPDEVAVFTRHTATGTLVAVISVREWAELLEDKHSYTRLPSATLPSGEIAETVRELNGNRRARLDAKADRLRARVATLELELEATIKEIG